MPKKLIKYTPETNKEFARHYVLTRDTARAYAETFGTRGKERNARAGTELLALAPVQAWVNFWEQEEINRARVAAGLVRDVSPAVEAVADLARVRDMGRQLELGEEAPKKAETAPNIRATDEEMLALLADEARTSTASGARVQAATNYLKLRQLVEREEEGADIPAELAGFIQEERAKRAESVAG